MSAVTCSIERKPSTPNNHFSIKTGTPYKVKTGYKIYADKAAYDAGTVESEKAGVMVEMVFESAARLAAGAAALLTAALAI